MSAARRARSWCWTPLIPRTHRRFKGGLIPLMVCLLSVVGFHDSGTLAGTPAEASQEAPAPSGRVESASGTEILPLEAAGLDAKDLADPPPEQILTVGVNDRITMHISELPLAEALRMLSEPTRRNIIMADGVEGVVTASMYNVTFEEALNAMLVSNGLGFRADGDFIYIHSRDEIDKMAAAKRRVSVRVFRLAYMNAASAKSLIEPMLSNVGKVSLTPPAKAGVNSDAGSLGAGGDSVATTDTLIVTDYSDRIEDIARILKQLDERPQQVLIETTVLRAVLGEDNAMGIDFTTVGGIDFTTLSSVSPAAQRITTGNTPPAMLEDTTFTVRTDLNAGVPAGGFTFGIIKDQIGVFIRALEQITETNILANPKILALNKQMGQVIVGRRDGYFTTTVTETAAVQSVEFLETGTILTFRPFIGDDGFVRMEIHPKDSTGGLTDSNLPYEQTTEVTTNIMVKDGHTILIGGLFREVSGSGQGQVPVLGNIPLAGALFRRTRDDTTREEVIILLTVHILKSDNDARASVELEQSVERFRVGMRRGLQWFGREKLSQAHYRWALEHLDRGNLDMALWDTDLALHLYPRHEHAFELRERLRGRRDWESEASAIRSFVQDRIAEENGGVRPLFGRPAPPFVLPDELQGPSGLEENDAAVLSGEGEMARNAALPVGGEVRP